MAKGFRQIAGRDDEEKYAPTAQHVTLRVLLAVASAHGLDIYQLDVRTAFLNGDLTDEVYLKLPAELGGKPWRRHKVLYGLEQAARQWQEKLRGEMIKHGFTPSPHEPRLLIQGEGYERVYVMIHVYDALVIGTRQAVLGAKAAFANMFDIKDLGKARHFLGMSIQRDSQGGYALSQPKYVEDMLARFEMSDCAAKPTPMSVVSSFPRMTGTHSHQTTCIRL